MFEDHHMHLKPFGQNLPPLTVLAMDDEALKLAEEIEAQSSDLVTMVALRAMGQMGSLPPPSLWILLVR